MIKGSFPISKVLVFEGNSYEDIRLFYDCKKNVIKGSFPISKVLFSRVIATYVEKMKIDYFMIAHGKECD